MNIQDIPNIPEILDTETAKRIKSWPHPNNRASEAGHPCIRFLVLSRTSNELKVLHDVGLQRIFDLGNLFEDYLLRQMAESGRLRVVEQQRAYEWPTFQLTGRIDGKLAVNGAYLPLEIKSSAPHIFDTIKDMTPEDMLKSKYAWIRKYPAQILLYMLMEGVENGIMIFINKTNGEQSEKVFRLEGELLEYAESILKKLEAVNAHVAAGTCPDAKLIDDCKGCAFSKTACFPGADYGPGIDILQDSDLEAKLDRRGDLEPAAKEFEALDKEIKDGFKGRPGAVVGAWLIESSKHERKGVDLPAEIKKLYEKITEYWITKIGRI